MTKYIFILFLLVPVLTHAQVKCKGTTKDGSACKSAFVDKKTGYCRVHDPALPRCGVKKKDGNPCRNIVPKEGIACKYHSIEH